MAEPHERPEFANSIEYTVTLTYRVAGGKRRDTAQRRAEKVAARLASAAARAAGVVDVTARAGASVNGEVTWTDRVRFEAANTGHASYRDPSLLDRYLDPEYERALRSLAAADEAARTRRRADQERRMAVGCRNATFPNLGRYCHCVYCDPSAHTAPGTAEAHSPFAEHRCLCGRPVADAGQRCGSHVHTRLVVLDHDPAELHRLAPSQRRAHGQ